MNRRAPLSIALVTCVVALVGCNQPPARVDDADSKASSSAAGELRTTTAPWDRPSNQPALVEKAGLSLFPTEHFDFHYHAALNVVVDGEPVAVPASLGINQGPDGQAPEHGEPGIAPLHTHQADGVLHVESARDNTFTLGQVFTLWGVLFEEGRLGAYHAGDDRKHQVVVFVNGEKAVGDPTDIALQPDQRISVVVEPGGKTVDLA